MNRLSGNTLLLLIILLLQGFTVCGQRDPVTEKYIETYKDIAIQKMQEYRIPASITLAQGVLESGSGTSDLARKANNHFGIKCHSWNGRKFYQDDDAKNECFRKYRTAEESFRDHSLFLTQRSRYASLFDLEITDYKAWAHGLKKAGYATNPKYPQLLIRIIEEYQLYAYDRNSEPIILTKKSPRKATEATNGSVAAAPDPTVSDFPVEPSKIVIQTGPGGRAIYSNNGVKFIYAEEGDNFSTIAEDFNIYSWQVYRYNDLDKKEKIHTNQIIYLEKKKNKAQKDFHEVTPGETMHKISQLYGVRLKTLYKKNNMEEGSEPVTGQKIKLR